MLKELTDSYFYTYDYDHIRDITFKFTETEDSQSYTCENIMAGDTETSSAVEHKGKAIPFVIEWYVKYSCYRALIDRSSKISILYLWQWGIKSATGETIIFLGRTLEDLKRFQQMLAAEIKRQAKCGKEWRSPYDLRYQYNRSENVHVSIIIGFHNFSFDMSVLENIHQEDFGRHHKYGGNVFARSARRPMKAIAHVDNMRIEYRDTYVLVNRSLANWGEDEGLTMQKIHKDQEWYLEVRTPETELDEEDEIKYACYDIATMIEGLQKFVDKYGRMKDVPLTQTGCVRRQCWEALKPCVDYRMRCAMIQGGYSYKFFKKLCKLFTGGWTHANIKWVNRIIDSKKYGRIICHDFSSSYPFVCTTLTMPTGDFKLVDVSKFWEFEKVTGRTLWQIDHRWFAEIRVKNVKAKKENSFFSLSKSLDELKLDVSDVDNGRIRKCPELHCLVSDFDWDIFKQAYNFDGVEVIELYDSPAELFPKELITLILKCYGEKTSYKGIEEKESLYKNSKIFVNAIFGLLCTKLIGEIVEYYNDKEITTEVKTQHGVKKMKKKYTWFVDRDEKHIEAHFDKTMSKIDPDKIVGVYPAGIWTCKAAMWNLWQFILKFDKRCIYCDTDSLKGLLTKDDLKEIDKYNEWAKEIADKTAAQLGFDPAMYAPKAPDGKEKRLGIFDREHGDGCLSFATKGAKRYYCEFEAKDKKTGEMFIDRETTIAGLSKKAGKAKIHNAREFLDEEYTVFDVSESMKQTAYYNDEQPEVTWTDKNGRSYTTTQKHGCCILPTSFDLSLDGALAALVELVATGQTEQAIFSDTAMCLIVD